MENRIFAWALSSALLVLFLGAALAQGETDNADSKIAITNASFVAPSPERENLNGEWVEVTNLGGTDENINLAGWTLEDEQNHTYAFPEFILEAGAVVRVHTGEGADTSLDLYWNKKTPIWNNGGDAATLKDASGNVVSRYPEEAGE